MTTPPSTRPTRPHFSSGPTVKRPGWSLEQLAGAPLGRSHRAKAGKDRLKLAIELTRDVLCVPADHRIGIVPASDTGAVEMALWSLLGPRPVDVLAWESFGHGWGIDIVDQLGLDAHVIAAPYGELPDLTRVDPTDRDVIFTWNGTTSGVRVPNADWIPLDRRGLTICDATSAAFAQPLDFEKLDVVTFSWQKALGGEGAHGMLILSPRAVDRLENYTPRWPLPKLFRLTINGKINEGIFQGETINTPSMLCVEDYIDALHWAEANGGLTGLVARADANAKVLTDWVDDRDWVTHLAVRPETRSNTSVCLSIIDPEVTAGGNEAAAACARGIVALLETQGAAYDLGSHRDAPPGLRIWCGATVETRDIVVLTDWLDWAFAEARAQSMNDMKYVELQSQRRPLPLSSQG
ncbi:phosphoserine transaminase [Prescottella equi]|uniref:phosphoserine transaminase n=1 Tax=Rhodococcus hoagii TaxID=43767 RepID=UPI0025785977|nr:phosphoserine transaminase [Prescottella equi]WJJ14594.1 phosphoserine transaminase [Prescottella equi]